MPVLGIPTYSYSLTPGVWDQQRGGIPKLSPAVRPSRGRRDPGARIHSSRICSRSMILDHRFRILYGGPQLLDPGSGIEDARSISQDHGSRIQDLGSRMLDPGPRILDTRYCTTLEPGSRMQDPGQ